MDQKIDFEFINFSLFELRFLEPKLEPDKLSSLSNAIGLLACILERHDNLRWFYCVLIYGKVDG